MRQPCLGHTTPLSLLRLLVAQPLSRGRSAASPEMEREPAGDVMGPGPGSQGRRTDRKRDGEAQRDGIQTMSSAMVISRFNLSLLFWAIDVVFRFDKIIFP